jgi:hypothetical protein
MLPVNIPRLQNAITEAVPCVGSKVPSQKQTGPGHFSRGVKLL